MSKLLNEIMSAGINAALFEQCGRRLWNVKLLAERASVDRFEDFERCLAEARQNLREAHEIYLEWKSRQSPESETRE
jgi:hypothetical protein